MSNINVTAETEATAELIKKHFYQYKSEQLGKRYNPHPRFRKYEFWIAAAEQCNELQADPHTFVRAAFLYSRIPGGPYPQNLVQKTAKHWFDQYKRTVLKQEGATPLSIYENEVMSLVKQTMAAWIRMRLPMKRFLLDTCSIPLHAAPAYVRIILMPKDPDVVSRFKHEARAEVIGNQQLLNTLKKLGFDVSWLN